MEYFIGIILGIAIAIILLFIWASLVVAKRADGETLKKENK